MIDEADDRVRRFSGSSKVSDFKTLIVKLKDIFGYVL